MIKDYVSLRDEVKRGEIYGIIRLQHVGEPQAIESDGPRFLDLTFPTVEFRQIIDLVIMKLLGQETRGSFIITGGGGTGKSHLLVALYHALSGTKETRSWLQGIGIKVANELPSDTLVLPYQLIAGGGGVRYLWEPLFHDLAKDELLTQIKRWPSQQQIKEAIGDRPGVLLFDEWEDWYSSLDQQEKLFNKNFLYNLVEIADERASRLVVLISSLKKELDISFLLGRPASDEYNLSLSQDAQKIVLFRLFQSITADNDSIERYLQLYQKNPDVFSGLVGTIEDYRQTIRALYPFHPELTEMAFTAFGRHPLYQHTRGVLRFLAELVKQKETTADLLLPGDVDPFNTETQRDISALDTREGLFPKFVEDLEKRLKTISMAFPILTPILLWSMADGKGLEESRVLLNALKPGLHIDDLKTTLAECYSRSWYLRKRNGNYRFERSRKIAVVVDERARATLAGDKKPAIERLSSVIKQIAKAKPQQRAYSAEETIDYECFVYPVDEIPSQTQRLKLVYSLTNLSEEQIREFFKELGYPNTVALILPRSGQDLTQEGDFLIRCQRLIEVDKMRNEVAEEEKKELKDVEDEEKRELNDSLRNAFGRWMKPYFEEEKVSYRPEPVPADAESIIQVLRTNFGSWQLKQILKKKLEEKLEGVSIRDTLSDLFKYQKEPMVLSSALLKNAVMDLVNEDKLEIADGIKVYGKDSSELKQLDLVESMRLKPKKEKVEKRFEEAEKPEEVVTPVEISEVIPLEGATPSALRGEVRNKIGEDWRILSLDIEVKGETFAEPEKLAELIEYLEARGVKGELSLKTLASQVNLSKRELQELMALFPIPSSPTGQLKADEVKLRVGVHKPGKS